MQTKFIYTLIFAAAINAGIGYLLGRKNSFAKFSKKMGYENIGHFFALVWYYRPMMNRLGNMEMVERITRFANWDHNEQKYEKLYGYLEIEGRAKFYGSK